MTIFIMLLLSLTMVSAQGTQQSEKSSIQGLENAIIQVQNETQRQQFNQVMEKIQTQDRLRLQNATFSEECEADTCRIEAENVEEARFLGMIKVQQKYQYTVNEDGTIEKQVKWYHFMFRQSEA